jgi:hypothetical protein
MLLFLRNVSGILSIAAFPAAPQELVFERNHKSNFSSPTSYSVFLVSMIADKLVEQLRPNPPLSVVSSVHREKMRRDGGFMFCKD